MVTEIIIGKKVTNSSHSSQPFIVPEQYQYVGREHAKIYRAPDGVLYIEDLNSTNGTYVNNRKVKRSPINLSDRITLGGKSDLGYHLPLDKVIAMLPLSDEDFNFQFNKLKYIWNYHQEYIRETNLKKQKIGTRRMLPMMIGGVFGAFVPIAQFFINTGGGGIDPIAIFSGIIALGGFIGYFILGNIITDKMRELDIEIANENEKFQLEYVCPDNKKFLGAPWAVIANKAECPCCKRKFTPNK